jgi:hypothetical protein
MSSLTDALGPKVTNLGQLIGLITQDGGVNQDWFSNAGTEIGNIPRQVPELLQLIQDVLGPASAAADLPGGSWYSIPSPVDGVTPTNFYLVAPPPPTNSKPPLSAQMGLGVMREIGYEKLSIAAYGFVPLFDISSAAAPTLVIESQPSSIGIAAGMTDGSTFSAPGGVTFESLNLDVEIYFSSFRTPTMQLVFGGLKGAPSEVPAEYQKLSDLLNNISTVGDWIASVILQGTYWLNNYIGNSTFTVGDILTDACVLTTDSNGAYQLNVSYLKTNVTNPQVLAENFLFNLLNTLANSTTPIIPIPTGADGSGIYVVKEAVDNSSTFAYGARLMIQDLQLGGGSGGNGNGNDGGGGATNGDGQASPPAEVYIQIGKWIASEQDSDSWVARSLGETKDFAQPGVSVYLMQSSSTAGGCTSTGPDVTFAPHVEFVSLGLDVRGGAGQPLFDYGGYTMNGAELRVYVKQSGDSVTFGTAISMDGLGLPLGPSFGSTVQGSSTNPVAQKLLESGSPATPPAGAAPGGDKAPINPAFSMSAAYVQSGSFAFQLYDSDGSPTDQVSLPVQRALGPLQCQKLGLGWVQSTEMLSLLFDGGIHLDVLSVDLYGLSIGIPVANPGNFSKYDLDLSGMGLTLEAGEVEVSAAFVKLGPDPKANPPRTYTEYDGEVLIKAGAFSIDAIGSYAYVEQDGSGFASLFIFGALDGDLGGPAFFYVTGLAAGFGYNRALVLPDQNSVTTFPLVAAASDPSTLGGLPPDPAKALSGLGTLVPPQRGEYWLAAGVRFTSFDLINSTALLVVEFGDELEIALLGLSWISLPPPAAPGAEPTVKYAYAELGIEIKLLPSKGVFTATAVLTSNSFVLDPACKLTGGFAFFVWFGPNEHAGEFVLTLGGYHPDFTPPSYYPQVPRLGFNWPMPGNVTISGEAYFALTPSAVMAGAGLQVLYSAGNLRAWFKAQMDALIQWAPFHYSIAISISLGASYRVHLLFVTATLKIELGASLTIWGPPMGGRVHINWYIISFTVSFGASESQGPQPLDWSTSDGTGFAQTLLPHKNTTTKSKLAQSSERLALRSEAFVESWATESSTGELMTARTMFVAAPTSGSGVEPSGIFTITVNDGLLATIQKDGQSIWIVRSNHFRFSAVTTIPATEIDVEGPSTTKFNPKDSCGADYSVYIRPMNAQLSSSVFDIKMTDEFSQTYNLVGDFDFDLSCHPVPAAKWGAPLAAGQDPEMNALLPGRLLGLENITPKQPVLTPSGALALDIDITQAFTYDIVDDPLDKNLPDPYHLPLVPNQTPSGPVPAVSSGALDQIKKALMDAGVTAARGQLLAALQGYGFDPVTNSPMATLAADPGAVLVGNPLILAST